MTIKISITPEIPGGLRLEAVPQQWDPTTESWEPAPYETVVLKDGVEHTFFVWNGKRVVLQES